MKIIGLDLSLVASGVILLDGDKIRIKEVVKSKPSSKLPIDELDRLLKIKETIFKLIANEAGHVDLILIEGLAFMARNTTALVQLSGLNYLIREMARENNVPFVIIAPTTLKKFVTGKGNCQKDLMLLETYKRYNEEFLDNNLCDAFGLAKIGQCLLEEDTSELPKFQQEVIKLLKPQLYGRD